LEWNLKQLREIAPLLEKAKTAYREIAKKTGVALHGESGVDQFGQKIKGNVEEFMRLSRLKAQDAQSREFAALQPKESLASDTKGRVTITDSFGGKYFFTCDETSKQGKTIHLIEAKHSRRAKMPNETDIKDGLLKMMLYANLQNVRVGGEKFEHKPVLRLTSAKLQGAISSESKPEDFESFCITNLLSPEQKAFLKTLFNEARQNRFAVKLEGVASIV
jgi:predicted Zn-dependent peptidase